MTDPVADMLTRIRNANMVRNERVEIPASKLKMEIARVLHNEGFIQSYRMINDLKQGVIRIYLKYDGKDRDCVISGLKRISKPGRRIYTKSDRLPNVYGKLGIAIISTSQGVKTNHECRRQRIGGEVLCHVW